ncbi:3-aminobutyryl-CoA ammonia lyase [Mesoaciditoga sp.]
MAYGDWKEPPILRVRISEADVHYAGGLVDGAKIMQFFGDVATELLIRNDGDEGLFRAYDLVEFLNPVHAGDYIEVYGKIVGVGRTSRKMVLEAFKVIAPIENGSSACEVLREPILVAKASGTCVVPLDKQRKKED